MKRLIVITLLLFSAATFGQKKEYKKVAWLYNYLYGAEFSDTLYVQEIKFADGTVQETAGGGGGGGTDDQTSAEVPHTPQAPYTATNVATALDEALTLANQYADLYKQDVLVNQTNIKSVNGQSLLGSGNLTISAGTPNLSTVQHEIIAPGNGGAEQDGNFRLRIVAGTLVVEERVGGTWQNCGTFNY